MHLNCCVWFFWIPAKAFSNASMRMCLQQHDVRPAILRGRGLGGGHPEPRPCSAGAVPAVSGRAGMPARMCAGCLPHQGLLEPWDLSSA